MSIIKRNHHFPAMTNLFDDFFTRDVLNWGLNNNSTTNTTIPAVNIRETKENFAVELAAPGMQKEDFKIELDGNRLTISSEKATTDEQTDDNRYTKREFSYQSFQRSFQLPKDVVDAEGIQARYENGLLQLIIPKKEEAKQKPPRMIQIS
jgi:HSP20 family protein